MLERSKFGSFPVGSSFQKEGRRQNVSVCELEKEQPETYVKEMVEVSCRRETEERVNEKVWELARGRGGPRTRGGRWVCCTRPWGPRLCCVGVGTKAMSMGLKTSAPRRGLDLFSAVSLVSKMVPGMQEALRQYRLDGRTDGSEEIRMVCGKS